MCPCGGVVLKGRRLELRFRDCPACSSAAQYSRSRVMGVGVGCLITNSRERLEANLHDHDYCDRLRGCDCGHAHRVQGAGNGETRSITTASTLAPSARVAETPRRRNCGRDGLVGCHAAIDTCSHCRGGGNLESGGSHQIRDGPSPWYPCAAPLTGRSLAKLRRRQRVCVPLYRRNPGGDRKPAYRRRWPNIPRGTTPFGKLAGIGSTKHRRWRWLDRGTAAPCDRLLSVPPVFAPSASGDYWGRMA
jgi:hypothetical protein